MEDSIVRECALALTSLRRMIRRCALATLSYENMVSGPKSRYQTLVKVPYCKCVNGDAVNGKYEKKIVTVDAHGSDHTFRLGTYLGTVG